MSGKFGEKLRNLRTSQRISLEELASIVGSSKAYIWQLENKQNARPSAELLLKIASALGQSPDFLLDDSRDAPSEAQLEDEFFRKFQSLSENDKREIASVMSKYRSKKDDAP